MKTVIYQSLENESYDFSYKNKKTASFCLKMSTYQTFNLSLFKTFKDLCMLKVEGEGMFDRVLKCKNRPTVKMELFSVKTTKFMTFHLSFLIFFFLSKIK